MFPAHFHLLAKDDGKSLPFPIWGSQVPAINSHPQPFFYHRILEFCRATGGISPCVGTGEGRASLHPSPTVLRTQKQL